MGNSLAFPSIQVVKVVAPGETVEPKEPLIGDTLSFDEFGGEEAIQYTLKVFAAREELARVKARFFVRSKNPFEPDVITVLHSKKIEEANLTHNWYKVPVEVTK